MGKKEKKEIMGLVYREFSRQKYNKYKHQFPKMRESQIVNKIIREWGTLDFAAKSRLKKVYCRNRALPNEDFSESEAAKKSEDLVMTEQGSGMKTDIDASLGLSPQGGKSFAGKRDWDERKADLKVETPMKNKFLGKVTDTDYITFFRHYYQRYSKEHPRWSASQVSKIVTLLWRKNKQNNSCTKTKFRKGKLERPTKIKKLLSGRKAFEKHKNLNPKDTFRLWKRLPIESRRFWQGEAQGKPRQPLKEQKVIIRANNQNRALDFLSKVIN